MSFPEFKLKSFRTIAAMTAIVLLFLFVYLLFFPVKAGSKEFVVREGEGLYRIADNLKKARLIKSKFVFIFYVKAIGEEKGLRAGRYLLTDSVSAVKIVSLLAEGLSEDNNIKVVIPEGFNIWEIDRALTEAGVSRSGDFARKSYHNEGYLFPDTYRFKKNEETSLSIEQTGIKMKDNFQAKIVDILAGLSASKKHEIVIIASILEKEAKTEKDMRLISGIIRKRMSVGMLLQIDATVSYGACLRKSLETNFVRICDVSQIGVANEIKIDSEFNSYLRKGLPPAPISNPGLVALRAAVNPLGSDYLYYLSTRSGDEIIYAKTPQEQAQNRKKYLGI